MAHHRATASRLPGCLLGGLLAAMPATAVATPGEVGVGQRLGDAPLTGLNGPSRRLADFRGKPLLINVWASWCGPCRQEMASLDRLAWLDLAHGFNIIGISTDDYDDRAQAWLHDSNATISQYIDRALTLENLLGASRLPLTVLVGADGRVLAKIYGSRDWDSPESLALIRRTFRLPAPAAAR
ncbi:MAG: TlpA family protein disulfide reductase [Proteobacteria bacterium]|nr:TlpA family protein disulfide reductase [Pseudomonadota bacterium]